MRQASVLLDIGANGHFTFLEGARWHNTRYWFVDLYTYSVYSVAEDGSDLTLEATVPGLPCGLGWLPDGRLLMVAVDDRVLVRREPDGDLVVHADLRPYLKGPRDAPNDMVVADDGTAYVGSFGFDARGGAPFDTAPVFRVTPAGEVSVAAEGLHFPNGATIVDGETLIVAESWGNRLSAFDIAEDGSLGPRRDWASFGPIPDTSNIADVFPQLVVASDGISSVDEEGGIWVADYIRSRAVRVLADQGIVDQVKLAEDRNCYSVALGGADGRTLMLCASAADTDPDLRKREPQGQLQTCRVEVPAARRVPV